MKVILIVFLSLLQSTLILCQNKIPAYGKIDKGDFDIKECSFDKGAEAIKLIDWGMLYYDRGNEGISIFKTIYEKRLRIKILNEKGLSYANVSIPYYGNNNNEKILKIEAITYNVDENGNITTSEVEKNSFYNKKIDKNYSQLSFAFPQAKVGSVIEFRYKMERERMGQIKNWYFQDKIPTAYSEYTIKIPSLLRFDIQPTIVDNIETSQKENTEIYNIGNNSVTMNVVNKTFVMRNLPGIRKYAYMGAVSDYLQRLEFQLKQIDYGDNNVRDVRTKWSDVVDELTNDDDFGMMLKNDLFELKLLIEDAKKITDDNEKVKKILAYFQSQFIWNEEGGIYAHNGWKKLWADKKGNTGDINLAFINTLNQAGVKALPLLVSSRENGLVNSQYPFTSQFNYVATYVPIGEKFLVIDAADKNQIYGLMPLDIVNTRAFLLTNTDGKMIDLIDDKHKCKVFIASKSEIATDGKITGEGVVHYSDYGKMMMLGQLKNNKSQYASKYFTGNSSGIKLDSMTINNIDNNTQALEHKIKYSSSLTSSGNYSYFNINLFTSFFSNPFLDETRYADIDFGYAQEYTIYGNYIIPDGYIFDELPKNTLLKMPDGSASLSISYVGENNLLNVKTDIAFNRSFYEMDMYLDFKEFYKLLLDKLNEQIVIKKQ